MRTPFPFLVLACMALAASPGRAEIEKLATICERGICPHWWPKVAVPAGWIHDREQSYQYNINALTPEGQSFASAETVMYANAVYKPRVPESGTLAAFIENDQASFKKKTPGLVIRVNNEMRTKDGVLALSWLLEPKSEGQWERIAYFEEDEYYMVFVISSRTSNGLAKQMKAFEALVGNYSK